MKSLYIISAVTVFSAASSFAQAPSVGDHLIYDYSVFGSSSDVVKGTYEIKVSGVDPVTKELVFDYTWSLPGYQKHETFKYSPSRLQYLEEINVRTIQNCTSDGNLKETLAVPAGQFDVCTVHEGESTSSYSREVPGLVRLDVSDGVNRNLSELREYRKE